MKMIGIVLLLISLTACSPKVGYGIGVTGFTAVNDNIAATEISADSETGIHGSIGMGSDIRL